ncbi:stage II sporulation protein D [Clostridium rectalis]|uniref:stage II sporulation protein D n=1 Tax=Clostridium rectalis TaxID=2040295 RepID=UPI000F63452C|nr:stage II sporulation protein D [Clostridium rectalis]
MRKDDFWLYIRRFFISTVISILFITALSFLLIRGDNSNGLKGIKQIGFKAKDIKSKKEDRVYKIKLYRTKEKKIEKIDLEEYIKGVVSGEMPAEFHIEALKAQAVAARTYALSHVNAYGGRNCSASNGADLCDSTHCQVYMNKDVRLSGWPTSKGKDYWNKIEQAVNETKGQVIKFNGKIISQPFYFSTSSGKTEEASEVFSSAEPYLKSVKSIGDEASPKFKTSFKYSYKSFSNIINGYYPKSIASNNSLKNNIKIKNRTKGGSVKELRLGKTTISGVKFRSMLGLNSANFTFKFNKKDIEIICVGYGHGVGMSQWGANALGKSGKKFNEILTYYYNGVSIEEF